MGRHGFGGKLNMFLKIFAVSFCLTASPPLDEARTGSDSFDYYFGEFKAFEMPASDSMAKLITRRLSESLFETNSSEKFYERLRSLKDFLRHHPEKVERLIDLDRLLQRDFEARLKKAKTKRYLYSASGAIVGALVGLPIGNVFGNKLIWIAVPAGLIVGASAGFLLGSVLEIPDYTYDAGTLTNDLELIEEGL